MFGAWLPSSHGLLVGTDYDPTEDCFFMKRLNFLVSLTNNDNDYQQEQAAAAEKAAR